MEQGMPGEVALAVAREIEDVGRSVLRAWSSRCRWCVTKRACRGDAYRCALTTQEEEVFLIHGS